MNDRLHQVLSPLIRVNAHQIVNLCLEHGYLETAQLLQEIDNVAAARLLENLPLWFGGITLSKLDDLLVANLLSLLEASAAARLLRALDSDRHQLVLSVIDSRKAEKIASIASYDDDKVGGIVRSNALSVNEEAHVSTVLEIVRAHSNNVMDYVYVVNENAKLTGVLPIKCLLLGDSTQQVEEIATREPDYLRLDDSLVLAATHPRWNRAKVMPVVDHAGEFAGAIAEHQLRGLHVNDIALKEASQALAETFEVGMLGLLRLLTRAKEGQP